MRFDRTKSKAKNVILMIADGIGFNGWLAADYYQGKAGLQAYQRVRPDGTTPVVLGMSHYSLNVLDEQGRLLESASKDPEVESERQELIAKALPQGYKPKKRWKNFAYTIEKDFDPEEKIYTSYTDSAAAGTALMTGRKTANGRLNYDWSGSISFQTIAEVASKLRKSTGAISSVEQSHATPAATIAHNMNRRKYGEIFKELLNSKLDVIMGAGNPEYDNNGNSVNFNERSYKYVGDAKTWDEVKSGKTKYSFVDSLDDFESLEAGDLSFERVIGFPRVYETLQARRDPDILGEGKTPSGTAKNSNVPDLGTMSVGALNILNQNQKGFFAMVEGGAVDWMGHANNMGRYIEEQIDFNHAVDDVIQWVEANSSWDETLLIVTSDHETGGIWGKKTFTNGSVIKGSGVGAKDDEIIAAGEKGITVDQLISDRFNPYEDEFNRFRAVKDRGKGKIPRHQFASGNHTNELVPLWAIGSGSDLFHQFTRTDYKAGELWGKNYGWDGQFVDNTNVFDVMNQVI